MKTKMNYFLDEQNATLATTQEVRQEAHRRLLKFTESYKLSDDILDRWFDGILSCSGTTIHGELAIVTGLCNCELIDGVVATTVLPVPTGSQLENLICEFETKYNCLVYYVLQNAHFLTMLYVSPYKEDWIIFDEFEFPEGHFDSYVFNYLYPQHSEFGDAVLCSTNGILVRIA